MKDHKDILDNAIEAWLNEPVPHGPSAELVEATTARIAELSLSLPQYDPWDQVREKLYHARRMTKPAAAAVIIIAAFMTFSYLSDKTIALAEVNEAVLNIDNILMENFAPGEQEPYQRTWISRSRKLMMYETSQEYVLYDLNTIVRKVKTSFSESVRTETLSEEMRRRVSDNINETIEIIPFPNLSMAPKGTTWTQTEPLENENIIPGTEKYVLEWTRDIPYYGLHRLCIYLNTKSKLPVRVDKYIKLPHMDTFQFENYMIISYPADSEIKNQVESVFEQH